MTQKGVDVAGVVVRDESGKFLCVQESKASVRGQWNMPAGHVEAGETTQQAAIREAREETGYIVELLDDEAILEKYDNDNQRWFKVYLARVVGGELRVDPTQVQDVRWLSFAEIDRIHDAGLLRAEWIYIAFRMVNDADGKSRDEAGE